MSGATTAPDGWGSRRAHAAIAAPARPRASPRDDSRVAQLNLRVLNAPPAPVIRTTYSSAHKTLLRGPVESELVHTNRDAARRANRGRRTALTRRSPRGAEARADVQLLGSFRPMIPRQRRRLGSMPADRNHRRSEPGGEVDVVRIEVVADSPIAAADVRDVDIRTAGPDGQSLLSSLSNLLDELHETAQNVVADITAWAPVRGRQHWLRNRRGRPTDSAARSRRP